MTRILYFSYWPYEDTLTQSCVIPSVNILSNLVNDKVLLLTMEGVNEKNSRLNSEKYNHIPFSEFNWLPFKYINKALFLFFFPFRLRKILKQNDVTHVFCRGALAGSFLILTKILLNLKVKVIVESFEPHADYMLESDVWTKNSIVYRFQSYFEQVQKKHADGLITVSYNYYNKLLEEKVAQKKVSCLPCAVKIDEFQYSEHQRVQVRKKYDIGLNSIVGVYVGKFGGIYLDDLSFYIFKKAFDFFEDFYLILLTGEKKSLIEEYCSKYEISLDKVVIEKVPHVEVPNYLSASDFAFSNIKPSEHRKYCSPIKNGEYWANGLPILIPKGIGDDSDIILKNRTGGSVLDSFDANAIDTALKEVSNLFQDEKSRKNIPKLAIDNRSFDSFVPVYSEFLFN